MTIEQIIRGIAEKWKESPADEEVYCQHVDTYRAFSECANELLTALPDILAAQKAETAAMMKTLLAVEKRNARIAMAEEMHILMRGATCGPHCLGCQRLAALRAEGDKQP